MFQKKKEKLHLLEALSKILLDIDKAIRIIRETESEADVVPNLMIGFGIDEIQAEYVAEIKLRNINRQYILRRVEEVDQLKKDIAEMEEILRDKKKIRKIIIDELRRVIKKYAQPRKTMFYYQSDVEDEQQIDDTPDYQVNLFVTDGGYFKKITPQSLRMSKEHKLKDGDFISQIKQSLYSCRIKHRRIRQKRAHLMIQRQVSWEIMFRQSLALMTEKISKR